MGVVVDISVSLDGFVTGPDAGPENGLGTGGEALHRWAIDGDAADRAELEAGTTRTGAVVMGRRTFDIVDAVWTDEMGYGAGHAARPPCLVVTHTVPATIRLRDRFTIVTAGLHAGVDQARAAAGDLDVVVMGGGDLCGQVLAAGLADELVLHVAPVVLGGGTPLFRAGAHTGLRHLRTVPTANAVHTTYAVDGSSRPSASITAA